MSANYTPYAVKIESLASAGVWLTWSVNPSIEHAAGTYYKIYVSSDAGVSWEEPKTANIKRHFEPLRNSYFWVAVSTVLRDGTETEKSSIFRVFHRIGDSIDFNKFVAVSELSGTPSRLLVDEDSGALKVSVVGSSSSSGGASMDISSLAKDSTLQGLSTMVASVAKDGSVQALSTTAQALAKEETLQSVKDSISSWKDSNSINQREIVTALAQMRTSVNSMSGLPRLLRTESTQYNVTSSGKTVIEDWTPYSIIDRVTVIKEAGSAETWYFEMYDCSSDFSPRHTIFREEYKPGVHADNRLDVLKSFSYINTENASPRITFRIVPDSGTDNRFYICITGSEARM